MDSSAHCRLVLGWHIIDQQIQLVVVPQIENRWNEGSAHPVALTQLVINLDLHLNSSQPWCDERVTARGLFQVGKNVVLSPVDNGRDRQLLDRLAEAGLRVGTGQPTDDELPQILGGDRLGGEFGLQGVHVRSADQCLHHQRG